MTKQRSPNAHLHARQPALQRKPGIGWLGYAGYAGLGVACLLLGVVAFLLVAAPVDVVRDRIVEQVRAQTGRELTVSGPTSLSLIPRPALVLSNVAFSAPPDMGGRPLLTVAKLEAEISLGSLLSGRAGVRRVVLTRPVIGLRVDGQGQRSWDLTSPGRGSAMPASSSTARQTGARGGSSRGDGLETMPALDISIVDGAVRYADERSADRQEINQLALDLAIREGAGPVAIKGSLGWRGERLAIDGALSQLRELLEDQTGRLTLRLSGRPIEATYEGSIGSGADRQGLDGAVSLKAASLQALASWLDRPLAGGRDPGAFALTARLASNENRVAVGDLSAILGDSALTGSLTVESSGPKPHVRGSLRLSRLDLGDLLLRPAPGVGAGRAAAPGRRAQGEPSDVTRRREAPPGQAPQAAKADWSDDAIDLAPLGVVDADLELSADSLVYRDARTGTARLALQLRASVATLTIEDMQLYDGRATGSLVLDGSGQVPATRADIRMDGVSVRPLLKGTLGFDWLEGQGRIALNLTGRGSSERQIIESLGGRLEVSARNGAIEAIDVGKILRSLEQGRFSGLRAAAGDKTPYSELVATFVITNGVAQNQDLRLVSPDLRVTGSGSLNLGARTLDYTVRPKIAGVNATTERAVINLSNLEIPVRIEGPWDKPNYTIAGQEQLIETVREIGKRIKPQDIEDALKGVLGGGDGQKVKPRDILDKLFKKQ